MRKKDLLRRLSSKTGLHIDECDMFFTAFAEELRTCLASGTDITINNFGRFRIVEHGGKKGRHPKTGEPILIPPRRRLRFKASDSLYAYID